MSKTQADRTGVSRQALLSTGIIALIVLLVALFARALFGTAVVGVALMGVFVGLTTNSLTRRQQAAVLGAAVVLTFGAVMAHGNGIVVSLLVLAAVGMTVVADAWVQNAAKLLPALTAYAAIGVTSAPWTASAAVALGICASLFVLWLLGADKKSEKTPTRTAENPQHIVPIAVFAVLAAFFTLEAVLHNWHYGYWMVIVLCSTVQLRRADNDTGRRIVGQTTGTIAGVLLAVLATAYMPEVIVISLIIPVLLAAIYCTVTDQYNSAAMATTAGLVLLLPHISMSSTAAIAGQRLVFIIGGLIIIALSSWLAWRFGKILPISQRKR